MTMCHKCQKERRDVQPRGYPPRDLCGFCVAGSRIARLERTIERERKHKARTGRASPKVCK